MNPSSSVDQIAGVQGSIRFDPARLRFVGQIADPPTLVMISSARAAEGALRIVGVNARGLPTRTAVFAFEVVGPGYLRGLRLEHAAAVTRGLRSIDLTSSQE